MPPKIPTLDYLHVSKPGTTTQYGCLYCLSENVEAPAAGDVIYMYQGTTMCADHINKLVLKKET